MNVFKINFAFLELIVQLLSVVSYTVVLKQVKPLYPLVKVYRYELRQPKIWQETNTQHIYPKLLQSQRLYTVPVKSGRNETYKSRGFVKKEKKFNKVSSSSDKPVFRDSHLLGLSQHLVPPVSNQITEYSETKEKETRENEDEIRPLLASPHFGKSFASFSQEKGKIHRNPGERATSVPQEDSSSSENTTEAKFTPSQLYLQIRHKNTVIHVPQSEALKDAETLEELINAPRLKELARTTHVQETYSEEGYEDAAYDHAGHIRQAQHVEVYDAKDKGKFKIKEPPIILDYDSDLEETKRAFLKKKPDLLGRNSTNKIEPRITRSGSETSKAFVGHSKIPQNYKGEHKYSSKIASQGKNSVESNEKNNLEKAPGSEVTFPSYFSEMSSVPLDSAAIFQPPPKKSSKYQKDDFNSTKIYPVSNLTTAPVYVYTDFNPYIPAIDSQASPSTKSLKYSKIYSKKTKQLRLEPLQNVNDPLPRTKSELHLQNESDSQHTSEKTETEELMNQRIVLPTIGYINSLTTAHFGKGSLETPQSKFKPQLPGSLNLTQALNYLRTTKNQQNIDVTKSPTEIDVHTFEPMKLKKFRHDSHKTKRDAYVVREQESEEDSDLPFKEKSEEIEENERKQLEEENQDKEKYEAKLKEEISKQEKEIVRETLRNIGIEDDIAEVFPKYLSSNFKSHNSDSVETTTSPINVKKYPFYLSKRLPENSPLRYATDPKQFPKKTGYKMEFYESRDKLIQCPDFQPDLSDLSDSNSTESGDNTQNAPRITGLGSKIACLRSKYFDPEPFDNPIFKEKEIDYVGKKSIGRKKLQTKVIPNKKDLKLQQSNYHKFNDYKLNSNEKVNFSFSSNQSSKPNKVFVRQEIKNLSGKTVQVPSTARPSVFSKTKKKEIMLIGKALNNFDSFQPQTFPDTSKPNSLTKLKTAYSLSPQIYIPPKLSENKNNLVKTHNYLPNISQIALTDDRKNLTFHSKDVILMRKINNATNFTLIPKKEIKREKDIKIKNIFLLPNDQSDCIPTVSYALPQHFNRSSKPMSRRTDEVPKSVKETNFNDSSDHYVIDELKEDKNVRKGEVMEDMDHYLKLMEVELRETTTVKTEKKTVKTENSTRKRREAQNGVTKTKLRSDFAKRLEFSFDKSTVKSIFSETQPKQLHVERPLKRLSGLDFLIRYHKSKNKLTSQKAEDFWKITTSQPITDEKNSETKKKPSKTTKNSNEKNKTFKETNGVSELRKKTSGSSSTEKNIRTKGQQNNEYRSTTSINAVPEKITKKPESKFSKVRKTQNVSTEKISSTRSHNFTKIITKISRETNESSDKPRIIYKASKSLKNSTGEVPNLKFSSRKPEERQYKTINRSLGFSNNSNSGLLNRTTENPVEPVLYYIVNLKTGRGKWVTNSGDQKGNKWEKHQKVKKIKATT